MCKDEVSKDEVRHRDKNGLLHREGDLPAVFLADGTQEWWVKGLLHREGGLPAVIHADGTREWWVEGKRYG
jgi:hypothetical protein